MCPTCRRSKTPWQWTIFLPSARARSIRSTIPSRVRTFSLEGIAAPSLRVGSRGGCARLYRLGNREIWLSGRSVTGLAEIVEPRARGLGDGLLIPDRRIAPVFDSLQNAVD